MAKAPTIEGQVKTLIGALTAAEAKRLRRAGDARDDGICQRRTRRTAASTLLRQKAKEEAFDDVEREGCLMIAQRGEDLGERLTNCFADVFRNGF